MHFLRLYGQRAGKPGLQIDDDALLLLKAYPWPGNIRQLENAIEHAAAFAEGPVVTVRDLPLEVQAADDGTAVVAEERAKRLDGAVAAAAYDGRAAALLFQAEQAERERRERELLVRALATAGGNKAEAARALGMARSTLLSRLKRLGLS